MKMFVSYKNFYEPSFGFSWHRLLRRTLVLSAQYATS